MPYYSKETIEKVKEIDLLTYLQNYDPNELIQFNKNTFVTKSHDSLKISNGKWFWFSRGIGAKTALEYLVKVKGYTFIDAVTDIVKKQKLKVPVFQEYTLKSNTRKLVLPVKANDNKIAKQYLMDRGISESIIDECIDNDILYQEVKYNNVVFVGLDQKEEPCYAMCRGTTSERFMQEATGSDKSYSFRIIAKEESESVHIFESAIDLLSYATLLEMGNKKWYKTNYLSLAGVYQPSKEIENSKIPLALKNFLSHNSNIKQIFLHLDNDQVGRQASKALQYALPKYYEVIDLPPINCKDWNDYLQKIRKNESNRIQKIENSR